MLYEKMHEVLSYPFLGRQGNIPTANGVEDKCLAVPYGCLMVEWGEV